MKTLSAELIAIIATGIALAGLQVVGQHRLEDRLLAVEKEQARVGVVLGRVEKEQARVGVVLGRVEKEQARVGVVLERVEKEQVRVGAILEGVETEQARFRVLHEGVGFTTHTHDTTSDRE